MDCICEFIEKNQQFKSIGVLSKRNESFLGGYRSLGFPMKYKVPGIADIAAVLRSKGIACGFKDKSAEFLEFNSARSVNIMTYHSVKGLKFDCIILPFSNYVNDTIDASSTKGGKNLLYVALTRASQMIVITYSGHIAEDYPSAIPSTLFEGEIVEVPVETLEAKKRVLNEIMDQVRSGKIDVKSLGFMGDVGFEDCDVFKY